MIRRSILCRGPSTKDVRQNLGFSNHPLPLSGCVRISKTTPPPRTSASRFFIFHTFSIFTHFYFCSLKQSLLPNSCFYKVKMLNTITFREEKCNQRIVISTHNYLIKYLSINLIIACRI